MEELNKQQMVAVNHVDGPMLVLAGAGSGKTRVVTYRIARLIDLGVLPSDILAVTFTNRAAEEMRSRIRAKKNAQVLTSTFHSLGARILRESISSLGYQNDFTIYDEEDREKLLKNCLQQLNLSSEKGLLKQMQLDISKAKNNGQGPESKSSDPLFDRVYAHYQNKLKECNALDFDDLLYLTVKLLQENELARKEYQNRWLFVLIDEYQDTNHSQHLLAKLLVAKHSNIFAVGDPDQSIYSWRGARYQNILNFERDFPGATIVTLDQNYRSTNTILQAANQLIAKNTTRYEKKLWSNLGEGSKIGIFTAQNERREAEFIVHKMLETIRDHHIAYDEVAIFYRTNAQSRTFEDALLSRRIPYIIIGGLSFYQRREIKDILSYLRMLVSNSDLISFLRTVNIPRRGIGATTLEKIVEESALRRIPVFSFCEELCDHPQICPEVKLSAKQREGLKGYVSLIHRLREQRSSLKLFELITKTIEASHYLNHLQEDPESMDDRKENLDELIGKAAEWEDERELPTLQQFLEELSLRASAEEQKNVPSVHLMTLHNSKGLEFSLVFIGGMEEELFPHMNSLSHPESLEEERRLCYVGMTRAKRFLFLTSTNYRYMWGGPKLMRPSRFLREIPAKYLQNDSPIAYEPESTVGSDPEALAAGTRVSHKEFGQGIVRKIFHTSFGLTYEVEFEEEGIRTLVAKYAKLRAEI
jgi:DNA helicase II / ATP-dependent DNA helicase PcrA